MSDNQAQALNRLLNKLSAVRATLKKEERELLDTMVLNAKIVNPAEEVSAHYLKEGHVLSAEAKVKDAPDEVAAHSFAAKTIDAAEAKVKDAPDEVAAHAFTAKTIDAAEAKVKDAPDEVAAHAFTAKTIDAAEAKVVSGAVAGVVAARYFKIAIDEASESYKVVD